MSAAVGCVTVAMALLLTAAPASALNKNVYSTSFAGSGASALSTPWSVAVDGATHDVYVSDTTNHRVEKFTPTGEFLLMFGKEVDRTKVEEKEAGEPITEAEEDLCTAASDDVCQPGQRSSAPGGFDNDPGEEGASEHNGERNNALWLALDNSPGSSAGDLYVGDAGADIVSKFDSAGHLLTAWGTEGELSRGGPLGALFSSARGLEGVAVAPDGTLVIAADYTDFEFEPDGSFIAGNFHVNNGGGSAGLAALDSRTVYQPFPGVEYVGVFSLNLVRGETLYANRGTMRKLAPNFSPEHQGTTSIALDPVHRDFYLSRESGLVTHLAPSCTGPIAVFELAGQVFTPEPPPPLGCSQLETFGAGHLTKPHGVALDPSDGSVYVADTAAHDVAVFAPTPYEPDAIPSSTAPTPSTVTLIGHLDPAGAGPITGCSFEYGPTQAYGSGPLSCTPSPSPGSPLSSPADLEAALSGLDYGTTYHFDVTAENANGANTSYDETFTTKPLAPSIEADSVGSAQADTALLQAQINPNGGDTTYRVQYVDDQRFQRSGFGEASLSPVLDAGSAKTAKLRTARLTQLTPKTTYHARLLATNATATTTGAAHTFTTLPFVEALDNCPNAHVRQQTSATLLLDCRAYELASAANAGGYDVESSLVPGQTPFGGYPAATGRLLYGVHNGGIPGTANPTNRGLDPYLATRGENGWTTEYVGIPANGAPSAQAFGSPLLEADSGLATFAFGGEGLCSPCFADLGTGIPVHEPNGELTQGMAGPEEPGPSAEPDGLVAKHLSADGTHLIFGSTSLFAPGGNDETGDVSIYDRNLKTGETHVVSNTSETEDVPVPLSCLQGEGECHSPGDTNGIAELDISEDGSRILLGQKVSEDAEGNPYYHLYMEINDEISSVDLTPGVISAPGGSGFTEGVLYDGMNEAGTKVFFTTKDALTSADQDTSADIYRADVTESGATLTSISSGTGGAGEPGNSDSCHPVANSAHEHWNTPDPAEESCGVVAIGGGGGVSSANGSAYFLSPEQLDGSANGTQNAPNLYAARPADGYAPRYVTTLESALTAPHPPKLRRTFKSDFGAFARATGLGIDHASGDLYVFDAGSQALEKFDAEGNPVDFTAGPAASTNRLTGPSATGTGNLESGSTEITSLSTETGAFSVGETIEAPGLPAETTITALGAGTLEVSQAATETATTSLDASQQFSSSFNGIAFTSEIAVDSAGDFYVPDILHGVVDKFSSAGEYLGQISGLARPDAIAIDPANGNLYVSGLFGSIYVFDSSGGPLAQFFAAGFPLSIAVDSSGAFYVARFFGGTAAYDSSGNFLRMLNEGLSKSVNVDTSTNDVYVDEGEAVGRYDSSGEKLETLEPLSGSYGVAIQPEGNLYATNSGGAEVAVFRPVLAPDPSVDNPLVLDSVSAPATRHTADFQLTPDGEFAAFASTLPLAAHGEENAGHYEVYRYDSASAVLACASCSPTGVSSAADSSLAKNGLSLTDDGRVFFDTSDQLVFADTDERQDAYEWSARGAGNCTSESPSFTEAQGGSCLALISAGTSSFASGLLSASADGTDAFFFTRDSLVPQDNNGPLIKVYDARAAGGFPYRFPPVTCKASDECHGPASALPPPISTGSEAGSPTAHRASPPQCKKGFVKKRGKCVKKPHHRKHHRRANHRRLAGHQGGHG